MGYAYKPVRFNDFTAVNAVKLNTGTILRSYDEIAGELSRNLPPGLILLDGYPTARFQKLLDILTQAIPGMITQDISSLYRPADEIQTLLLPYLPQNREMDPELIFGRLYDQDYQPFLDQNEVDAFLENLPDDQVVLLYGQGSACELFRSYSKAILYIDVTPKDTALRVCEGEYQGPGSSNGRSLDDILRQTYYIDVELAVRLRKELIANNSIDYYMLDSDISFSMLSRSTLQVIFNQMECRPLRAKPVYVEGVWGGQFIKRLRGIPNDLADKISWSFELIPSEASVVVEANDLLIDIPFLTLMDRIGKSILGQELYKRFEGKFPIRFNYDDTWHSNGNMSIQCHPNDEMIKTFHGDFAGQNEAYYVVLTGHDAKTFCGFKGDGKRFLGLCKQSEMDGSLVPYSDYVNAIPSSVGRQFFIPAGTIHSSGRNQLILELGTLTSNAYTYKIYDYLREDITGKPRPIHTKLAEKALVFERDSDWVNANVAFPPRLISEGEHWREYLIGHYESMYFETHRVELDTNGSYQGENKNGFTVITIVDGEMARVQSADDQACFYDANYLDVILIPASIRQYEVVAQGKQPLVLHKAFVREDR